MTSGELAAIISQGEGLTIEFKREWARDVGEKMASFANTHGGDLLIGIEKQGTVAGIPSTEWERLEESVANIARNCQPPLAPRIERVEYERSIVMCVHIERSLDVHQAGGITWVRVGSTTRAASQEEITRLLQDRGKLATDEFVVAGARYEDLQIEKLARYVETRARAGAPRLANGRDLPEIAAALVLVKRQDDAWVPTVAGILFFGKYPQQFIRQSTMRALRFQGTDVATSVILDRAGAGLEGTLDEMIDAAVAFVGRNMKVARLINGIAQEIPEYPLEAVREAVANALVHRDYTIGGREVLIRMFDDRLEIESPGGLAGNLSPETLGHKPPFARNPRLATLAVEFGKAERAGSGIPRIRHQLELLGSLPPDFRITGDSFMVTFYSRHYRSLSDVTWDWFRTALLHDVGKIVLDRSGQWTRHNDLRKPLLRSAYPTLSENPPDFVALLGATLVDQILAQSEPKPPDRATLADSNALAVHIADAVHKAMHRMINEEGESLENDPRLSHLKASPSFYPYYGEAVKGLSRKGKVIGWTEPESAKLVLRAVEILKRGNDLGQLFELQSLLLHFPHTSYIPHLSLGLHQRFSAAVFYLAWKKLEELRRANRPVTDLDVLRFSLITVTPDPLGLFYRLRNIRAFNQAMEELRLHLFERVFARHKKDLPYITPALNPFEFFGRTSLVLVYDNARIVVDTLREMMQGDQMERFRALRVETTEYPVALWQVTDGQPRLFANPNVNPVSQTQNLLATRATDFDAQSDARCVQCNTPIRSSNGERGLCAACAALADLPLPPGTDLGQVAGEQRLGFVFLNLQAPLRDNAVETGLELIDELAKDRRVEPRDLIKTTPTGLFEYLQVVMEIAKFQDDAAYGRAWIYPLVEFPELMVWVMREEAYWDFLSHIGALRQELRLESALSGVLCHPRTPFWSLMDRLTKFTQQEGVYQRGEFYDLSGGEVMIFTDEEVKAIRDLARSAFSDQAFKNQLNALVALARTASLRELEMEIDERDHARKLRSDFCAELKAALNRMLGDDQRARDKRALFIKNIVRLAGFQTDRGQSRPRERR